MKIYNMKNFISGMFMLLLGVLNLALGLIRKDFDLSLSLIVIALLIFGSIFIYRSLSKRLSKSDKLDEMDERNQLVLLKNRSRAFQIHRYVCLGLTAVFFVMAAATKSEKFKYVGIGFAFAFSISLCIDIITFIYYDSHN